MAYAQSKGAAGEREFSMWLLTQGLTQTITPRNLEQSRSGGIDLIPRDHPFAYEIKRVESITSGTFDKWWIKAQSDVAKINRANPNVEPRDPVVAYRTSRSDWFCIVSVEKLLGVPGSYAIIKGVTFIKFAQKRISGYG
jgi:hypothetical protein